MKLKYLENLIKQKGFRKSFIANKLDIEPSTFSNKLHGKYAFSADEIKILIELLKYQYY